MEALMPRMTVPGLVPGMPGDIGIRAVIFEMQWLQQNGQIVKTRKVCWQYFAINMFADSFCQTCKAKCSEQLIFIFIITIWQLHVMGCGENCSISMIKWVYAFWFFTPALSDLSTIIWPLDRIDRMVESSSDPIRPYMTNKSIQFDKCLTDSYFLYVQTQPCPNCSVKPSSGMIIRLIFSKLGKNPGFSSKPVIFRKNPGFSLTSRVKPRFTFKPEKFVGFRSLGYTVSYTIYVYPVHSHINCICIRLPGQPCRKVCTPTYSISNVPKKRRERYVQLLCPFKKHNDKTPAIKAVFGGTDIQTSEQGSETCVALFLWKSKESVEERLIYDGINDCPQISSVPTFLPQNLYKDLTYWNHHVLIIIAWNTFKMIMSLPCNRFFLGLISPWMSCSPLFLLPHLWHLARHRCQPTPNIFSGKHHVESICWYLLLMATRNPAETHQLSHWGW